MTPIRIGILGYGNLGRGVECAVRQNDDMVLQAVFTRRDPQSVSILTPDVPVCSVCDILAHQNEVDVLLLCGGSATDLPVQTPEMARHFHVIDSFDTHAKIPRHFEAVDAAAKEGGKLALISCGWDPGLFSISRIYAQAVLPHGQTHTFWGKGVSQGHSDAIRRIEGVADARQYTIPVWEAMDAARSGRRCIPKQKHVRECFVALHEGADAARIEQQIKTMPDYFADYDTTVHFIPMSELRAHHSGLAHGGLVIRSGQTGRDDEHNHVIEYSLKLDSNPEFTACVLAAYARAIARMAKEGHTGCKTVMDIAPGYLSPNTAQELRKNWL